MKVFVFLNLVANQVLKRNHVLNGVRLIVTPYTSAVPCEKPKTIHVSGLKKNVTKEHIEVYFESKRSGGGDIENITMNENEGKALITFVDPSGNLSCIILCKTQCMCIL